MPIRLTRRELSRKNNSERKRAIVIFPRIAKSIYWLIHLIYLLFLFFRPPVTAPTPMTCEEEGWSIWYNLHFPDSSGEFESVDEIRKVGYGLRINRKRGSLTVWGAIVVLKIILLFSFLFFIFFWKGGGLIRVLFFLSFSFNSSFSNRPISFHPLCASAGTIHDNYSFSFTLFSRWPHSPILSHERNSVRSLQFSSRR